MTAVELGADMCALARTNVRGGDVQLLAAETLDPAAFPGIEAFTAAVKQTRKSLKLPRRCCAVVWGLPDGATRKDPTVKPLIAPLTGAGFKVQRIVSPCNALAALARLKMPRGDGAMCWLAINRTGVAMVVVRPGTQLYSHSFQWDSNVGLSGSQARLLQRYSLVAFLAPEIRRAMSVAREKGTPIDAIVTCGNLPEIRSLTMPLIEELDVEVESLDSLEGLIVTPDATDRLSDVAASIRIACAGVIARPTRQRDESKRRSSAIRTLLRGAAAAAVILGVTVVGWGWWERQGLTRTQATPPVRPNTVPPPAPKARIGQTPTPLPAVNAPTKSVPSNPPVVNPPAKPASSARPVVSAPAKSAPVNPPVASAPAKPALSNPLPAQQKSATLPPSPVQKPAPPPAASATALSDAAKRAARNTPTPSLSPAVSSAAKPPQSKPPAVSSAAKPPQANPPAMSSTAKPPQSKPPAVSSTAKPPQSKPPAVSSAAKPPQANPPAVSSTAKPPQSNPPGMRGMSTRVPLDVRPRPADKLEAAPVRPPGPMPELLKEPVPRVTAILVSNDRRMATIDDGHIIAVGDVLGKRTVVAIDERAVVLREPSGVQIRVALGGRIVGVERGER